MLVFSPLLHLILLTCTYTIAYLQRQNVTFIEPDMWPPNSPDLNAVDYVIWGALQERVSHGRKFENVEHTVRLHVFHVFFWGGSKAPSPDPTPMLFK